MNKIYEFELPFQKLFSSFECFPTSVQLKGCSLCGYSHKKAEPNNLKKNEKFASVEKCKSFSSNYFRLNAA